MSKRTIMIILATVAVIAVVGVGVAAAASGPPAGVGHGPYATNASGTVTDAVRDRVRARDGTGPHHPQGWNGARQGLRLRDGTGPRHGQQAGQGYRGADCPYRN